LTAAAAPRNPGVLQRFMSTGQFIIINFVTTRAAVLAERADQLTSSSYAPGQLQKNTHPHALAVPVAAAKGHFPLKKTIISTFSMLMRL